MGCTYDATRGQAIQIGPGGHAKVHHPGYTIGGDHDIGRADVTVHNTSVVGVLQALRHLAYDSQGTFHPKGLQLSQDSGKGRSFDILHDDIVQPLVRSKVKDLNDVG